MDKKQKLEELVNKQLEIGKSIISLEEELKKSENYDKYNAYVGDDTNEAVLETMFPTEHELAKKLAEARGKLEPFYKEILKAARALYKQLNEKIENLEKKLKINEQHIENLDAEIKEQEQKINDLKATEEYKAGDEATLLEVEKLENALDANKKYKETMTNKIEDIKKEIDEVKKEAEALVVDHGEKVKQVEEKTDVDSVKSNKSTDENEKKDENKENNKNSKKRASNVITIAASEPVVEISEPDKAGDDKEKTEEDPEKKLETEFKELFSKAKRGALTDKDFDKFSEIMSNPENYDRLGITTGIVFNKAKTIFKAMAKTAMVKGLTAKNAEEKLDVELQNAQEIVKQDRDSLDEEKQIEWDNANKHINQCNALKQVMKTYSEVSESRKQARWDWIYEKESEATPALAEKNESKPEVKKDEFSEKLAEQTVETPDYKDVPVNSQTIDSQEQTK